MLVDYNYAEKFLETANYQEDSGRHICPFYYNNLNVEAKLAKGDYCSDSYFNINVVETPLESAEFDDIIELWSDKD